RARPWSLLNRTTEGGTEGTAGCWQCEGAHAGRRARAALDPAALPVAEQRGRRPRDRFGVIQQAAVGDRPGCIDSLEVVGADDRFRGPAGFRTATASATEHPP